MTDLDEQRDTAEERANPTLRYEMFADWADVVREFARFASDRELPAPLTVTFSGDDTGHLSVAVSGPAHAAWFEHFDLCHHISGAHGATWHRSHGYLDGNRGVRVELTCFADDLLPSAVGS